MVILYIGPPGLGPNIAFGQGYLVHRHDCRPLKTGAHIYLGSHNLLQHCAGVSCQFSMGLRP